MAKVIKRGGINPDSIYVAGDLVHFDEQGIAEVTNKEQLAILKEIAESTGQYVIEDGKEKHDKAEKAEKEDAPKKHATKKKSE